MRKRKYTKEFLSPFVKQSTNYTNLLRNLGLKVTGGVHRLITMRIKEYGIDTSHFKDGIWNKGLTQHTNSTLKNQYFKVRTPHEQVFCENSGYSSSKLFGRLVELGWLPECSICKTKDWLNKPIRFHVDHKNGNHTDNRMDNLRFLCPNCHQQTETWGSKK